MREFLAHLWHFAVPWGVLCCSVALGQDAPSPRPADSAQPQVTQSSSPASSPLPLGPGQAAIEGSTSKSDGERHYKSLRYEEDYGFLSDPSKRTDFWDALKYIPFGDEGDQFVSLGADVREWFESYHNDGYGAEPANSNGFNTYFLQRYMLYGDVHFSKQLRAFVQSISGFEDGRIGGPRPEIDRDIFDVHQAFVDWTTPLGDENEWTWRIGRQEFRYGSGRLIDVREGPNLRLSFDAARALTKFGEWSIDGWWGKPVENRFDVFDDKPDPDIDFWGAYGVRPIGDGKHLNVDVYYLGYSNRHAEFNGLDGHELRHSLGTRIWAHPMPWEYNVEYVYQFGEFGQGRINAWTAANAVRYNFQSATFKPATGIRFDVASGDQSATSPNLQTFNPMFPSGAYFNLTGPFGPMNIIDLHPTLDLHLSETVKFSADWNFFWRQSLDDGVYRLSGSLLASDPASDARFIASSPSATLVWNPDSHVTVLASYVHVFPGGFLKDATPGKPLDYVTTWLSYRF